MAPQKSAQQSKILLDFMEVYPELAKGFVKGNKLRHDQLWNELTSRLNDCGPPHRDCSAWKKTWSDWRRSIKRRLEENKSISKNTEGGDFQQHYLSPIEERLAVICNIFDAAEVIENTKTFGCRKRQVDETIDTEDLCEVIELSASPSTSNSPDNTQPSILPDRSISNSPVLTPMKKPKTFHEDTSDNLAKEKKDFEYMAAKLCEIAKTLNESAKYFRDISKNLDEIRSLKEKELEETKRHNLEMEKLHKIKIETKIEFLKLERIKFGINN